MDPEARPLTRGAADRVDDDLGVREHAGWISPSGTDLFCHLLLPLSRAVTAGLVVCSPYQAESNSQYRWEVTLGRTLAAKGLAVARFDYRGTGSSGGDLDRLSFESMTRDAVDVIGWLRSRLGDLPVAVTGGSLGGLVAAAAAVQADAAAIILRGPAADGSAYLRAAFRSHLISSMRDVPGSPTSAEHMLDELRAKGRVELLGNHLPLSLYETVEGRELATELHGFGGPVLLLRPSGDARGGVEEELRRGVGALDVIIEERKELAWLVGAAFKPPEESTSAQDVLDRIVDWVGSNVTSTNAPAAEPSGIQHGIRGTADFGSRTEEAVFFPSPEGDLFGILALPRTGDPTAGVVMLSAGNFSVSAHRSAMWAEMAEVLAAGGLASLRIDYHGVGASAGTAEEFVPEQPFTADAKAATSQLVDHGVSRVVLIGECWGGRTALAAAARDDRVGGLFLIGPALRDGRTRESLAPKWAGSYGIGRYLRRGLRRDVIRGLGDRDARRAYRRIAGAKIRQLTGKARKSPPRAVADGTSPLFLSDLEAVVSRGAPVHLIFGSHDGRRGFEEARRGRLGELLERAKHLVDTSMVTGRVHQGMTTRAAFESIVDLATTWIPQAATRERGAE